MVLQIYRVTKKFPAEERFGLTNQMRRAAVSISSNIAEGFSRFSLKEKINLYVISHSSTSELQNQIIISRDIGYIFGVEYDEIMDQAEKVSKIISGLIKSTRNRQ